MNDAKILRSTWNGMKSRCLNPNNAQYHNYGGRGITVCERWRQSFEAFCEDMGPRPPGTSIDRINNDLGYSPENCRWATPAVQRRNQRTSHYLEFDGKRMVLQDWADYIGISRATLDHRINLLGWSVERALTTPALPPDEAASIARSAQSEPGNAIFSHNSSGYRGVSYHKRNRRYRAQINHLGKQIHIGEFPSADEAAHAYNKAAIRLHGESALLNPIGADHVR